MFETERIRADFAILKSGVIYLDSAATSLTPEPVLDAVLEYYRDYNANIGRGLHRLTRRATQEYEEARSKVARFIGAEPQELVFTKNTTEGINLVASGLGSGLGLGSSGLKKGDKVVVSLLEHHSNLLPWIRAKSRFEVDLEVVKPEPEAEPESEPKAAGEEAGKAGGKAAGEAGGGEKECRLKISDFERVIDERTKVVAVTQVSNALGSVLPVKEIARLCKENGALLLVDAAQSVPHFPLNVKELGCDFLAFSGHKMLGPTGTGGLFVRQEILEEGEREGKGAGGLEPLTVGGGAVEDASFLDYRLKAGCEKFESGTQNIAGALGLGAAVEYLEKVGMKKVKAREERLAKQLLEGLQELEEEERSNVEIYGYRNGSGTAAAGERIGTVSFNLKGTSPDEVASRLDREASIAVRSGHHCCIPLMKHLGLGAEGTVRASVYLYNTEEEVEKFLEAVEKISKSK